MVTSGSIQNSSETAGSKIGAEERFYRPELDVLRFFAFLGVFFYHLKLRSIPPGLPRYTMIPLVSSLMRLGNDGLGAGNFGVDLFFVLSSYLITELLVREKAQRGFLDVKAFYVRRTLRIWPLYFFFIGIAWVLHVFVPGQVFTWQYVLAFLLLSGNWISAQHALPASVALPLWSVSVEEQFYLLWPRVVRRSSLKRLALVAVGLLVLASGTRFVLLTGHTTMQMLSYSTFTRLDGIAVGILTSLVLRGRIPLLSTGVRSLLVFFGLGGLMRTAELFCGAARGAAPTLVGGLSGFPLVAVACTLLFLSVLGLPVERMRIVGWLRLVYLGKISYGLYGYHYLSLLLARRILGTLHAELYPVYALLGLALTVAFSIASYQFLELPFLRLKERYTYVLSRPG